MSTSRSAALQELKKRRQQGKSSALQDYKVNDNNKIYDELDEASYQMVVRRRLHDDFVVDDDGLGYADYGVDDWDEARPDYSSDAEQDEVGPGKSKSGPKVKKDGAKRKRAPGGKDGSGPVQQDINAMFLKQQQFASKKGAALSVVAPQSAKRRDETAANENEEDDISALLEQVDNEGARLASMAHSRKKKKTLADIAMFGSRQDIKGSNDAGDTAVPSFEQQQHEEYDAPSYQQNVEDYPNVDMADHNPTDEHAPAVEAELEPELAKVKVLQKDAKKGKSSAPIKPVIKPTVLQKPSNTIGLPPSTPMTAGLAQSSADSWFKQRNALVSGNQQQQQSTPAPAINVEGGADKNVYFEENGSILMFWIDAYEGPNGVVFLFGKVYNKKTAAFDSCCLTVNAIERCLFFLPRPKLVERGVETDVDNDMQLVWEEVDGIMTKHRISNWSIKECEKKYAFEVSDVPVEADWVEMNYAYSMPSLPSELTGRTFSHVFGSGTSALETLILKTDLMGPCWIEIQDAAMSSANVSWCRFEISTSFPTSNQERAQNGDCFNVRVIKDSDLHSDKYPEFCKSAPPLTVMSLSLKTVMNYQKNVNEIVMASALIYQKVQVDGATPDEDKKKVSVFTTVRQLDAMFPIQFVEKAQSIGVQTEKTERGLLNYLLAIIHRNDPDIIVGHNFVGFDLDVLLHRMKENKISFWSKLGRIRRSNFPKLQGGVGGMGESTYAEKQVVSGRLLCDSYLAAKDTVKAKSYSLSNLAEAVLKCDRPEVGFEDIPKYYADATDLLWLAQHCENDAYLSMKLIFHMMFIPLTKQLTNLAGNLWTRTMAGARAERNEFLLLHEFTKNGYIVPDRKYQTKTITNTTNSKKGKTAKGQVKSAPSQPQEEKQMADDEDDHENDGEESNKKGRRKPAYSGGLVLEPKKGLYDKFVLMLDFNSLYPSIIQEYNICFTTVERNSDDDGEIPNVPESGLEQGILPKLLGTLVARRRQVKSIMKTVDANGAEYAQLNIRQQALKLTANSMYGCLGFTHSRFYAKPLAMLITSKGREILQDTVNLAEQTLNLNVIYGDTDSIVIYTGSEDLPEAKSMGVKLKAAVNKKYKLLEIEIDAVFKRMLLLKKKKYAALTVTELPNGQLITNRETKGLDLVRRDWCGISHDVSNFVLDQILSDADSEDVINKIHEYLTKVGQDARAGLVPIEKYVINKSLTKAPEEYNDAKVQPHVQVALRMKAKGMSVRLGDTVPYVICLDADEQKSFALRAHHPDDVKRPENNLKIDIEYYLNNQVHPPIARLCRPIEGTDDSRLADCLGLDPAKFRAVSNAHDVFEVSGLTTLESQISDAERFKNAERMRFGCSGCGTENTFEAPAVQRNGEWRSGLCCSSCGHIANWQALAIRVTKDVRMHIKNYYNYWLICDEPSCGNRTKQTSVLNHLCMKPNCRGMMQQEYSDSNLYTQIMYYSTLFDVKRFLKKQSTSLEKQTMESVCYAHADAFSSLHGTVQAYLENCSRAFVDFKTVFSLTAAPATGQIIVK